MDLDEAERSAQVRAAFGRGERRVGVGGGTTRGNGWSSGCERPLG
ncbi:hypothetical protein [Streptomyces sp. NPDC005533]